MWLSQTFPLGNFTGQEYDIIANYEYIRGSGSIPIIDYNPRNEKLSLRAVGSTSRRHTKTCLIVDMTKTAILLLLADCFAGQTVLTKHVNG